MYLESITDQQFTDLGQNRQLEILSEHCAGIEDRIRRAPSRKEAEAMTQQTCEELREACISELVQGALLRRTEEIVERHWGKRGTKSDK
jgi:hypothetical protein